MGQSWGAEVSLLPSDFAFVIVVIVGGSIIVISIILRLFGSAAMCGRPDFVGLSGIFFCRSAAFRSRLESGHVLNTTRRVLVSIISALLLASVLVDANATGIGAADVVFAARTLARARARTGRARRRQTMYHLKPFFVITFVLGDRVAMT